MSFYEFNIIFDKNFSFIFTKIINTTSDFSIQLKVELKIYTSYFPEKKQMIVKIKWTNYKTMNLMHKIKGKLSKRNKNLGWLSLWYKIKFVYFVSLLPFPFLKLNKINSFMNQKIIKNINN